MTRSENINELVAALALAQKKFSPIFKENDNPAFRSKYADLATVIAATQKALAENGLVVIQLPNTEGQILRLITMLAHSSGQWIANEFCLPATMRDRFDAQAIGSALTYGRRYALQAILGVAADVDDDGNGAADIGSKEAAQTVGQRKIAQHKAAAGQEGVSLVPWKEKNLVIAGNGLAIVRSAMTEEEKLQFTFKYDADAKGYTIPLSQGIQFSSACEKYKVSCEFVDKG